MILRISEYESHSPEQADQDGNRKFILRAEKGRILLLLGSGGEYYGCSCIGLRKERKGHCRKVSDDSGKKLLVHRKGQKTDSDLQIRKEQEGNRLPSEGKDRSN